MCVKYVATVVVVGVHQIITTVVDTLAVNVRINSASLSLEGESQKIGKSML